MRELIVDLFAGGGGASTGIEQALGVPVDIAVNHDPEAIMMHYWNHPHTRHYAEDVFQVKPLEATGGQPVGLMWASPDCTHHSRAKGGKPVSRKKRFLAIAIPRWAKQVRPRVIILENVPEFKEWGPTIKKKVYTNQWSFEDGEPRNFKIEEYPDPKRKGVFFKKWIGKLERLGYQVQHRILNAADYGAPTNRKRLFVIARCDGRAIVWPKPTHGKNRPYPYRTAAECIDFSRPCPSIFDRKKPLAPATEKRIAKGIQKFVIETGDPFVVRYYGKSIGNDLFEPAATISAKNHDALVMPFLTKYHGAKGEEARGQVVQEPLRTQDTQNRFALVAPMLVGIDNQSTPSAQWNSQEPLRTITTENRFALVSSFLTKYYQTNIGSDLREPVPTVTATGQHIGEVRAFLVKYYSSNIGSSLEEPMHTLTGRMRMGLVTVAGVDYQIVDIGLRMLDPEELKLAQGFPKDYKLTGSKTSKVAKIGNSVCPPIAAALVRANVQIRETQAARVG
jgi:DNA (cytosine-5)-methyltransferase 1